MKNSKTSTIKIHSFLEDGDTLVILGGGPAGAFFAIHFLQRCRELQRKIRVLIIERRIRNEQGKCQDCCEEAKGCGYCAGGLSPRLLDALEKLDVHLPPEVIQSRIRSITIQGYWKNIELIVPKDRPVVSVFRGLRPARRFDQRQNFDTFLLSCAQKEGAELMGAEVFEARYADSGKPLIGCRAGGVDQWLEADFVVFAGGVNAGCGGGSKEPALTQVMQKLVPGYTPPRLRKSLIFELETAPGQPTELDGELHFVEYGSPALRLEMCSVLPKRGYITVVLVGPAIDASPGPAENRRIIKEFLELPHISKLMAAHTPSRLACLCNPRLVVGPAHGLFGERVAAVGDMAVSRLYKDGIRSAYQTAQALAEAIHTWGLDVRSLREAYEPVIHQLDRDNRFAARVFHLHRIIFSSSVLSRVLYQAVITERKNQPKPRRRLEKMLWNIASGDEEYETVFNTMTEWTTLWQVFTGGVLITLRNYLTEVFFGLSWDGIGRYTTGIALEVFEARRAAFSRSLPQFTKSGVRPEFERMYTIRIRASRDVIMKHLGRFGEPDRGFLQPRWVKVQRTAGQPNEPGCVIRYQILHGLFSFSLDLEQIQDACRIIYRVRNGFAMGGILLFEIEPAEKQSSNLTIYLAYDFAQGKSWGARLFWTAFRLLFPAFVHDVIWNQALCQFKNIAETNDTNAGHTRR
jgi:flavin-dependent dehydrogenase